MAGSRRVLPDHDLVDDPPMSNSTHNDVQVAHQPLDPGEVVTNEAEQQPSDSSNPSLRLKDVKQLRCEHGDCLKTFSRQYELKRHVQTKHGGQKPFACIFPGCLKGSTPPAFARPDKLTSHIRNSRGRDVEKLLQCPHAGCVAARMPLGVLTIHIVNHRRIHLFGQDQVPYEYARALVNAASTAYKTCPLWRCGKTIKLALLAAHLLTHPTEELNDGIQVLQDAKYSLKRADCTHTAGDESSSCLCSISGILIHCPVCNITLGCQANLETHIDIEHLIAPEHRQHFQALLVIASKQDVWLKSKKLKPWNAWALRKIRISNCPWCLEAVVTSCSYEAKHHLTMQANLETIKPFRREILKLYPAFASHPVWNDL